MIVQPRTVKVIIPTSQKRNVLRTLSDKTLPSKVMAIGKTSCEPAITSQPPRIARSTLVTG